MAEQGLRVTLKIPLPSEYMAATSARMLSVARLMPMKLKRPWGRIEVMGRLHRARLTLP